MPDKSVSAAAGDKGSRFLPNPTHLAWGIGTLGTITMINSISALYLFFLASVLGMSPVLAGTLIFISKIADMVTDPVMGWLSDRTNTRWGRRRPYMFFSSFACAGVMVYLFTVPADTGFISTPVYVELGLLFFAIALTVFNVPYLAMPAEMTDDYHERSSIMSYRAAFLVIGGFVGSGVSGQIIEAYGGGAEAYRVVGYTLAAIVLVTMLIATLGTNKARFTVFTRPTIPTVDQFKLFFVNKPFLILGGIKAIQFMRIAAGGAVTLFFFVNVLDKGEGLLLPFGLAVSAGLILSLRFWLPVIKRFGKREVFAATLLLEVGVHLSWLLATPQEPLWVLILRGVLFGTFSGATVICGQSMVTDTIEYDRRLSGINREGLYSSVMSFIEKFSMALGPLVIGALLTTFGFDSTIPRGQPQPDSAIFAILFGQAWIPAICSTTMALALWFYRLDEQTLHATEIHELGQKPS